MQRIHLVLALLLILPASGSVGPARAQEGNAGRLFESGLAAFRSADYGLAATAFGAASEVPGRNPYATAAGIMAAKAEFRAGRYDAAEARARILLDRQSGSRYRADAWWISALAQYRTGRYDIAASSAAVIVREHGGTPFEPKAVELFSEITASHLPLSELKRLAASGLPPALGVPASVGLARAFLRMGEDSLAAQALAGLRARSGVDAASVPDIGTLREETGTGGTVRIAALLPLGAGWGEEGGGSMGSDLLDGIRFAEEEYNAASAAGRRVEIEVHDVGRDTTGASSTIASLAASPVVRAVLGPVFTPAFASASAEANARHLPIISPTATGDRLAATGPFVFQANPDNATRGRAAARYAVEDLRMSSFVVLASDDPVGRSHAQAFDAEARALGATVYAVVYFPPDATDLRREFLAMRRAVMADGSLVGRADLARPSVEEFLRATGADSLPAFRDTSAQAISVTALFGARGYAVAESLGLAIVAEDTTAEQLDVPMVTADGIYIALGDPGQLDYVAPQLDYFNIRAQVIGNNEWYDPQRLRDNRAALDGALFLSDFDDGRADPEMAAFSASFARRNGKPPTKFTLYGYDTMRLLLEQMREGTRTREDIARRLSLVDGYQGLHAPISLGNGRVNRHLHVMKFEAGEVRRIGRADGGER